MLITPALLQVKTHTGRGRRELATSAARRGADWGLAPDGMAAEAVLSRLDVSVMPRGPEVTEWDCIRSDHAAMADAGEWDDLLEALRFADQEHGTASGGRRVAGLISEGARSRLTGVLALGNLAEAEAELRRFEAVQTLHADDPAATCLLAQAMIDVGTAKLAMGPAASDNGILREAAVAFETAEGLLSLFDPFEEMSPLLAATRYHLLPGLADADKLCRDWYQDWCDLDPEDAGAHAAHAAFLLAGGGVSAAAFEKAARRAMGLSGQITDHAAYAVFHLTAHRLLGSALPALDLPLLEQGLMDYQAATGCQHRANVAASLLADLVREFRQAGPEAVYPLTKARAALSAMLWNRLRDLHLESWTGGAEGLAFALDDVFGPALQKGARIQRAGGGLGTRIPRG